MISDMVEQQRDAKRITAREFMVDDADCDDADLES